MSAFFPEGAPCVSTLLTDTRSAVSTTATLYDFARRPFNVCGGKSQYKFHDLNANGTRDAGEPGLQGWRINLYTDPENNDTVESGQAVSQFGDTDAAGNYSFGQLLSGNYIVCEALQTNWFQSRPVTGQTPPSGETLATCPGGTTGYGFAVGGGGNLTGNDFGNFQQGTISGTKFKDANDNGAKDSGEVGLSGSKSYQGGTEVSGSPVTTNGSGNYSISLNPGTYTLCEEITDHPGWVQSYPVAATSGSVACTGANEAARGWQVTVVSQGTTTARGSPCAPTRTYCSAGGRRSTWGPPSPSPAGASQQPSPRTATPPRPSSTTATAPTPPRTSTVTSMPRGHRSGRGLRYEGEDFPGSPFPFGAGDALDIDINFRGEVRRRGRVVQTLHWTAIRGVFR